MMINDEVGEAWAAMRPPPPPPPGTPPRPTAARNPIPPRSLALDNAMIRPPPRSLAVDRNTSDLGKSRSGIDFYPSLSDTTDSTSNQSASTNSASSRNRSIVDKRRRVALAIYKSEHSKSDESKALSKKDEAWDPILMDRLSPSEDSESDFSFSEPPWTDSISTESSEKAPPKPHTGYSLSPVSEFRSKFSPRNQVPRIESTSTESREKAPPKPHSGYPLSPVSEFRSQFSPRDQVPPKSKDSPKRQPMSPLSEFRNHFSPKSGLTPRTVAIEGDKERWRHHKSLFDSFSVSVATSVTPSVDSRMSNGFVPASAAQSPSARQLSISTSLLTMPGPSPVVPPSPEADSLAYSAATTRAASISPSMLAVAPEMPSPVKSPSKSPRNWRKSTDDEHTLLASTPEKSPLDTAPSEKEKRKKFFKNILGRRGKEKDAPKSPGGSHDNPTTPVKSRRKSASSDKSTTTPKLSRRKKKSPEKIGRPQNIKPGQSYKSTPHSAEIVVRRSVEPSSSSDDIENLIQSPSWEGPRDGSAVSDSGVDLSSSIDENAQLDINESFSSPRFESIEEARDTFSSSCREESFKHSSSFSPSHDDGVSAITEPSYHDGSEEKRAREQAERVTKALKKGDRFGSDPLGRYWDESENIQVPLTESNGTIDPFVSPFFETQATSNLSSEVTNLVSNHSHSVDAIDEMRSSSQGTKDDYKLHTTQSEPEDAPEDEISENRIHVAERVRRLAEREKVIALENQLGRMGVQKPANSAPSTGIPVIRAKTLVYQSSPIRTTKSIDPTLLTGSPLIGAKKSSYQRSPVPVQKSVDQAELTGISMTPSRIVERRIEIAERRKHIEAKLNAVGITPVNTSLEEEDVEEKQLKSPGSRISGKAFAYLRALKKERESSTLIQEDSTTISGDIDLPSAASTLPSLRDHQDVFVESSNVQFATKSLLDRFQGRKPRAPSSSMQVTLTVKSSLDRSRAEIPTPSVLAKRRKSRKGVAKPQNKMTTSSKKTSYVPKPLEVNIATVSRGIAIKRRNRQKLIMAGDGVVARRQPKRTPSPEIHIISSELDLTRIKDPIKRAGLRVLTKSAIPIQSGIRRFLAQRNAVDRLWALVELQSYYRRWKCEAFLLAYIYSTIRIQAAFRGWHTRDTLACKEHCITQIQAAVRGYLASLNAYERLHHAITLQAVARGMLARNKLRQVVGKVVLIQKNLRGFKARIEVATWHVAATIIQAGVKCYLGQLYYQFDIVDIIIVQSVVRRWSVLLQTQRKRNHMLRKKCQEQEEIQNEAACQIQAAWRGFHAQSMFILVLADILVMQRTVRGWLAARQVKSIQQGEGATKIQRHWRGYKARVVMLYRLVHIIIVQSVIRQHLARKKALSLRYYHTPTCQASATQIQAVWRGFWGCSNYLIMRFELIRAQAAVRGHIVRCNARLRLGCIIILQAAMRGFLDRQRFDQTKMTDFIVASKAVALRERLASKRVHMFLTDAVQKRKEKDGQSFNQMKMTDFIVASKAVALRERLASKRVHMFLTDTVQKRTEREKAASKRLHMFLTDAVQKRKEKEKAASLEIEVQMRKEKAAALKIEGFFLMVKKEVDREILRYQKKRSSRSSRRGKSEADLSSWLSEGSRTLTLTDPGYNRGMARYRAQGPEVRISDARPTVAVRVDHTDDVSVLTSPSVFKRQTAPSRRAYEMRELGCDSISEEAWIDEIRKQQQMKEEYFQRHGIQDGGTRRRHPHAPYGGRSPVDHRRGVQSGLRTHQFSETFAPMPKHNEEHHWFAPSDRQYRPRPEQSMRPRINPSRSSHPSRIFGMSSEPHYHGHHINGYRWESEDHSSGYRKESEGSYGSDERPRVYNRYGEPRGHDIYSSEQQYQQGIERVSTVARQYHQQRAPRAPTRAPQYYQQEAPRVSTSVPLYHGTPRVSNPPRRHEIDGYEEFAHHPDVRKRMV